MATQPRAGDGAAAAAAEEEAPAVSYLQACVELDDWWLERVEGEEGKVRVVGSNTTTSRAGRRFTSASIKTRHASGDLETEDGIIIMIARPPNISKMHLNGFPDEVSKHFSLGFPVQWENIINSNMTEMNEQPQSPLKSTEYYIEKFLRGNLKYSMGLFAWDGLNIYQGSRSDADRFPSERLSNSSNGRPTVEDPTANTDCNANFMSTLATSEEFCTGRMDMPEEPRATPSETCGIDQENNQHLCMHMNTCDNGNKVQHGTSSVGPSAVPAEKYVRSQAEQDALLVNNSTSHVSSILGDCATPKCGKALTHLGTKDALETNEGMNPQFGVPQGSEGSTVRRLRNGKVIVISTSASTKKKVYKRARMQDNTFSENVIPNEDVTCPTGLISQEKVGSVTVAAAAKLKIHDTPRKGSILANQ
uniref:SANTA domain-containing protein n=1 Tax=Oryza meridionalis TaxID=40149 RepID=A0A0E0C342_9ORYZ